MHIELLCVMVIHVWDILGIGSTNRVYFCHGDRCVAYFWDRNNVWVLFSHPEHVQHIQRIGTAVNMCEWHNPGIGIMYGSSFFIILISVQHVQGVEVSHRASLCRDYMRVAYSWERNDVLPPSVTVIAVT